MTAPVRTIGNVDIYDRRDYGEINEIQQEGLKRIALWSARFSIEELDRVKILYPDLFPSDEFNISIKQLLYDLILEKYNDPEDNFRNVHFNVLISLQNPNQLNVNKWDIYIGLLREFSWDDIEEMFELLYGDFWRGINNMYREKGFEYHYFGWLNTENILYKAKRGQISLRPDTFEAGSLLSLHPGKLEEIFNSKLKEGKLYRICRYPGKRYLGWKKQDMFDAIINSGLMKTIPYKTDPNKSRRVLEWKAIGEKSDVRKYITGLTLEHGKDTKVPAMPMCGLEAVYQKLYNTKAFINWPYLCSNNSIGYNQLKKVANEVFGIKNTYRMRYSEICQAITQVQDEVRQTQLDLAKVAKKALPQILLKPGSRWIKPEVRQRFKEGARETNPVRLYNNARRLCDMAQNKSELLQGLTDMGLRGMYPNDMTPYTKEDICEDLLYGLKYQAEKYGKIEIYCENPEIPLDVIYALAERAGLDAILPTNWEEYTKEDICAILTRYLNILRKTKDPTLPRKMSQ